MPDRASYTCFVRFSFLCLRSNISIRYWGRAIKEYFLINAGVSFLSFDKLAVFLTASDLI